MTGYPDLRAWSNLHFKADMIFMNIQQADIIFVATGATGGRVNLDKYDVCQQGRIKTDMQKMLMKIVHNRKILCKHYLPIGTQSAPVMTWVRIYFG